MGVKQFDTQEQVDARACVAHVPYWSAEVVPKTSRSNLAPIVTFDIIGKPNVSSSVLHNKGLIVR